MIWKIQHLVLANFAKLIDYLFQLDTGWNVNLVIILLQRRCFLMAQMSLLFRTKLKRSFYKSDFRVLFVNSPLSDPI